MAINSLICRCIFACQFGIVIACSLPCIAQVEPIAARAQANASIASNWRDEFELGQFHVHCDFEMPSKKQLLLELQGISADLYRILRVPQHPEDTVHIVLFSTKAEYRRYMKNYFPEVPERRAVFLQDRGPGMLFAHRHEELATDLRHEVTHALLNTGPNPLPLWLDEGLAEYFENRAERRFQNNTYAQQVQVLAKKRTLQTIPQLAAKQTIHELTNEDYRDSWAWVHFMIHRSPETRMVLIRFLEFQRAKQASFDLERALQGLFPDLQAEFQHHFQQLGKPARLVRTQDAAREGGKSR